MDSIDKILKIKTSGYFCNERENLNGLKIVIRNWDSISLRQFTSSNWTFASDELCALSGIGESEFASETIFFRGFSTQNGQWTEIKITNPACKKFLPV